MNIKYEHKLVSDVLRTPSWSGAMLRMRRAATTHSIICTWSRVVRDRPLDQHNVSIVSCLPSHYTGFITITLYCTFNVHCDSLPLYDEYNRMK